MRYIPIETRIQDQFDTFFMLLEKLHKKKIQTSTNQYNMAAVSIGIYNKYMTDEIYDVINTDGSFVILVRMKEDTPDSFFGSETYIKPNYRDYTSFNEFGYKFNIIAYRYNAFDNIESAFDMYEIIYSRILMEDSDLTDFLSTIPYRLTCIHALYRFGYIKSIDEINTFRDHLLTCVASIFSYDTEVRIDMEKFFKVIKSLKIDYPSMLRGFYSCLTLLEDKKEDEEEKDET